MRIYLSVFLFVVVMCMTSCGTMENEKKKNESAVNGNSRATTAKSDLEFSDLAGLEFWFGSGAGGWCTTVKIQPDGTFEGYYSDIDAGDSGSGYSETIYECHFNGRFTSMRKNGDYEYSMKCESLMTEGIVNEERIIDGTRFVTSEPNGFEGADDFALYLPGKKIKELSKEFLSWSHGLESSGVLTCYGLYNVRGENGFIVWPE